MSILNRGRPIVKEVASRSGAADEYKHEARASVSTAQRCDPSLQRPVCPGSQGTTKGTKDAKEEDEEGIRLFGACVRASLTSQPSP